MASPLGLEDKRAVVVGGGLGIGRETCLLLGGFGAHVAVVDLDQSRAEAVRDEVAALGVKAIALSGDVTDRVQAEGIVDAAAAFHGGLDVSVNIVGMAAWGDLLSIDDETWYRDIDRNLTQHLYVSRAAARHFIDQGTGGRIAVVASVSGLYGAPMHASYGAAKAGLMDLVRTMAHEWGGYGIRVNAVAPDVIATPRMVATLEAQGVTQDENARKDGVPLARGGQPHEIAGPLTFLVSDLSSFMTGQTLVVDGGMRAAFPHLGGTQAMKAGQG
jgi:NAD(P)-dependent dehydrogenase (short-subunit alcohol dehydrogenase family)